MKFVDSEMKELGRSTQYNTHNTRPLIRTLKYVPDIVADRRSLYGERVQTHKHTHTHTHTHKNTDRQRQIQRQKETETDRDRDRDRDRLTQLYRGSTISLFMKLSSYYLQKILEYLFYYKHC